MLVTSSVECHATGSCQFMVLPSLFLNQLLGHGITSCEQDGGCDALGQEGALGQSHLVPKQIDISNCSLLGPPLVMHIAINGSLPL